MKSRIPHFSFCILHSAFCISVVLAAAAAAANTTEMQNAECRMQNEKCGMRDFIGQ